MKLSELNPEEIEFQPPPLRLSNFKPDEIEIEGADPKVSQLESGLRGAAQGASLGFADEALGALSNLSNKLVNPNASLFDTENYAKVRDSQRAADAAAQQANPGTYLAGQLGGSVALPVGSLNAAKGALLGGAQALGGSNAEDAGDLARDTGTGAILGGAAGAIAPYVSSGVSKLGDLASDAFEGAGNAAKSVANAFANRATNSKLGREALDSGIVRFGDTATSTSSRIAKEFPDSRIGAHIKNKLSKRVADEAEGFFSDADKMGIATSLIGGPAATASVASGIVGKNLANTRGAASGAVALDQIGDILKSAPQSFGKFAGPLQAAEARGALNPTVFVLQQTNPEFRKILYGDDEK